MSEWKLMGVADPRTGEVHHWIARDGKPVDLEDVVGELIDQQTEIERLRYCHMCGDSEIDCDLEACYTCNQWTCSNCSVGIESDEGDAIGVICCDCDAAAREAAGGGD